MKNFRLKYALIAIAVFSAIMSSISSAGASAPPVIIDETLKYLPIGKHLEYVQDRDNPMTFKEVTGPLPEWKRLNSDNVDLGFSFLEYWFRFTVENRSGTEAECYLEIGNSLLDIVELYIPEKSGKYKIIKTGNSMPFSTRMVNNRNFVFKISQGKGTETYYFRLTNFYMTHNFFISIKSQNTYFDYTTSDVLYIGMHIGVLIIMVIYNLFLFFTIRDDGHLKLIAILLAAGTLFLTYYGFGSMYLWTDSLWWSGNAFYILSCLTLFTFGVYLRTYFDTQRNYPIFDKLLLYVATITPLIEIALMLCDFINLPRITIPKSDAIFWTWSVMIPLSFVSFLLYGLWVALRHSGLYDKYSSYIKIVLAAAVISFCGLAYMSLRFEVTNGIILSRVMLIPLIIFCPLCYVSLVSYVFFTGYRPARYIFAAGFVVAFSFMILILTSIGILPLTHLSIYIIPPSVCMGTVFISLGLADKLEIMKKEIVQAEIKYSDLVESSNDIIFSLDRNLHFVTVNRAINRILGFSVDEVINKNFMSFLEDTWNKNRDIDRNVVGEYINEMKERKKSVAFRTVFKTNLTNEPIELSVKLEYAETESLDKKDVILGKASLVTDDILLQFLDSEKHYYTANNYLSNARLLTERITRNLGKYLSPAELPGIKIALREILVNAIEHGNLDIKYEEKSKLLDENKFFDYFYDRQNDPRFKDRKICIEYFLDREKVTYKISDEGEGFDHVKMRDLHADEEISRRLVLQHGRGLLIASNAFDVMRYNEKGNEVVLLKYFKSEKSAAVRHSNT